jgi:hypothetical protein
MGEGSVAQVVDDRFPAVSLDLLLQLPGERGVTEGWLSQCLPGKAEVLSEQIQAQIRRQVQDRAKRGVRPVEVVLLEVGAGLVDPRQCFGPVVRLAWSPCLE